MRNYKSSRGKNTSIYSQRKYMYNFFKQHGFDINSVFVQYNEVKPGKLYKLLNTKGKWEILLLRRLLKQFSIECRKPKTKAITYQLDNSANPKPYYNQNHNKIIARFLVTLNLKLLCLSCDGLNKFTVKRG